MNPHIDRRQFLSAAAAVAACGADAPKAADLHLAPFRFDVTPPKGHPLCGGWIKFVEAVDDELEAVGFVLFGVGKPVVICAVDWTGLLNETHVAWRTALAEAAGTTPERVAVQCVHQHNAPFASLDAQKIVAEVPGLPPVVDRDFFQQCLDRGRKAVTESLGRGRRITHIAGSQARVDRVASNRRVQRDANGNVLTMRGSRCTDAALRDLPDGTIDPWLKTVTFLEKETPVAACHYYAVHPMSYYGDGRVSSDFVGLARKRRQKDVPDCHRLYFTGCAGDVAAGKYNDGGKPMRAVLTQRLYDAMVESEKALKPELVGDAVWKHEAVNLPALAKPTNAEHLVLVRDGKAKVADRNRTAMQLAWNGRAAATPIIVSALAVNNVTLLHLPAECFVEYQLRAQRALPGRLVATAAYGDGGPWYLPTADEYPRGGYEVRSAFCPAEADARLNDAVAAVTA